MIRGCWVRFLITSRMRRKAASGLVAGCWGLVAAFAVSVGAVWAASEPQSSTESFTLANGLEVIVIPNHRVPAVSHMMWYRVGAADDPVGKSGLAHYHEHVMFLGTQKVKRGEYTRQIAEQGGDENAFTGYDATSYYVNIAKEHLGLAMELEADRMGALAPVEKDVVNERDVIIEERRLRIENNPNALLSEQVNAALYRNHPYHVPVIGWMKEMEGLTLADVQDWHAKYYHPNNAILILSGDVTAAEVKPMVEKYYGALPKAPIPARVWKEEPPQNVERRVVMRHANVKQESWYRDYAASSVAYGKKEEALPLFLLSQLMGGGKTSALYTALVVEQKIASSVDVDYSGFTIGPAEFSFSVTPAPGVTPAVVEAAVDKVIAKVLKDGFTAEDIARAKTLLKAETLYARDGLGNMGRVMGTVRICGLDKDYFTRWPQLVEAVSAQQIMDAAKDTLVATHAVTAELLPGEALPEGASAPKGIPVGKGDTQ